MPHPEAPVESRLSPANDLFAELVALPELREMLRKTLQIGDVSCTFGLPRRLVSEIAGRWLSGPHALFALTDSTHFDQSVAFAALPTDQAVALIDRSLGAATDVHAGGIAAAPSEAECGVLAYLGARCVRICSPALRLRDVTVERPAQLRAWPQQAILWPLRALLGAQLELDLKLILVDRVPLFERTATAQLAISDVLDPNALTDLRTGDLLTLDGAPFSFTARGLSGVLELSALGYAERIRVALDGGQLKVLGSAGSAARGARARFVLHEVDLPFAELAELCSGAEPTSPAPILDRVRLEVDARTVAAGELVRHDNRLAMRVETLYSMR